MRKLAVLLIAISAVAADITLPPPQMEGGLPLHQALKLRRTEREFRADPLTPQMLSNLLWAAFGINRPDGKRTAPSAWNQQEIDLYVFTAEGVYVYDAKAHALKQRAAGDRRAWTGKEFAAAPVSLVYVADFDKAGQSEAKDRLVYSALNTGYISQNVYLFCASAGLGTVAHDAANKDELAKHLNLRAGQRVILSQAVGRTK
jgi:SagB-type dehydrogenase family enzyme